MYTYFGKSDQTSGRVLNATTAHEWAGTTPTPSIPLEPRRPEWIAQTFAARVVARIWGWIFGSVLILGACGGVFGGMLLIATRYSGAANPEYKDSLVLWGIEAIVLGALSIVGTLWVDKFLPQLPKKTRY